MAIIATYSFVDVVATITGPGGSFPLGNSAAPGEGGISVAKEQKNTKTVGADGSVMNSMHANESGSITVHTLKISPVNALLSALYQFQRSSSLNWGQNQLVITEIATGDVYTCVGGAFKKYPDNEYAQEGNILSWEFDFGFVDPLLGTGTPAATFS